MTDEIFAGYLTCEEMAAQRRKTTRTLRAERLRGEGPPYVRDRRAVMYPVQGFRDWLASTERLSVRGPQVENAGRVGGDFRMGRARG
jgi:hypothetical protein